MCCSLGWQWFFDGGLQVGRMYISKEMGLAATLIRCMVELSVHGVRSDERLWLVQKLSTTVISVHFLFEDKECKVGVTFRAMRL